MALALRNGVAIGSFALASLSVVAFLTSCVVGKYIASGIRLAKGTFEDLRHVSLYDATQKVPLEDG